MLDRVRSLFVALPAAAVLLVGSWASTGVRAASAKAEYARKEGKECSFCHVNPKGGGSRTEKGIEYGKNNHKFLATPGGFGEDDAFTSQANGQAWYLIQQAVQIEHWTWAYERLRVLQGKEKKGPGAQKVMNLWGVLDGKGRALATKAKEAVAAGQAPEAAEALIRLETEFKGRDPAKEVGKIRTDLQKLAGGKEAETAARAIETQRLAWFAARMQWEEGKRPEAIKAANDLAAKFPEGPFAAEAKAKVAEWEAEPPPTAPAGMGG